MAEQIGAQIKEARLAAGMTQKELAAAIDGLTVKKISEAERGLRELTDEQVAAIAEVTQSESLLGKAPEETPEVSVEEPEPVAPIVEEAAPAEPAAEAESKQDGNPLDAIQGMLGSMMGGADPLAAIMTGSVSLDANTVGALAGMVGSIAGGISGEGNPLAAIQGGIESLDMGTVVAVAGMLNSIAGTAKKDENPLAAILGGGQGPYVLKMAGMLVNIAGSITGAK